MTQWTDAGWSDPGGERLGVAAALCRNLLAAWGTVQEGLASLPGPEAPGTVAAAVFRAAHPDAPARIEYLPGQAGGLFLTAIGQHLAGVVALLESNSGLLGVWPLVRSEAELAGRIAWILDPTLKSGDRRMARIAMEVLADHCRSRFTASRTRIKAEAKAAKRGRDEWRAVVVALFPDGPADCGCLGDESSWKFGGEEYRGLTQATEAFARSQLSGQGIYDSLPDFSHPSQLSLSRQTRWVGSGAARDLSYEYDFAVIEWQVKLACMIFYRAAHHVIGYYLLDDAAFRDWEDSVPTTWFKDGVVSDG